MCFVTRKQDKDHFTLNFLKMTLEVNNDNDTMNQTFYIIRA